MSTEQRVWSSGVDLQATFVPVADHVLTSGLTFFRDRSGDLRTTTTTMSLIGQVALGQFGPAAVRPPTAVQLGSPLSTTRSVSLTPSLRDVAVFVQDEWRLPRSLSLVTGLRGDFYGVTAEATPGRRGVRWWPGRARRSTRQRCRIQAVVRSRGKR